MKALSTSIFFKDKIYVLIIFGIETAFNTTKNHLLALQ